MPKSNILVVWNTEDHASGFDAIAGPNINISHVAYSDFTPDAFVNDVHGIILTGTDLCPRHNLDHYHRQQQLFYQKDVPVLAICGAFQVMALTFGAEIIECEKPIYGRTPTVHDGDTKLLENMPNSLTVFCKHRWAIVNVDSVLNDIAWSTDKRYIYGIYRPGYPHWGVQFHPERRNDGTAILNNFARLVVQNR